ncbi:MAG: M48 family metallopeptidase [Leptospiraceae bacterium]|nr:M48 family metallopeptidase [Leptospiraceae bacterium]
MNIVIVEYFDGRNPVPFKGELEIYETHLEFRYKPDEEIETYQVDWKLIQSIENKGDSFEIHIFIDKDSPFAIFVLQDKNAYEILQSIYNKLHPGFFSTRVKKLYELPLRTKLISISIFLAIFIFLYFQGLQRVHTLIPQSVDKEIGSYVQKQILKNYSTCSKEEYNQFLHKLINLLADRKNTFNITIVKQDVANAISLPGGEILIFSGLFKESESPEEIAGVLAHEIAHIEQRHGIRQLIRVLGISFLVTGLIGIGSDSSEMIETYSEIVNTLILLKYSRSFEEEADRLAVEKLNRLSISTEGLIQFFKRNAENDKISKWLNTHPSGDKRIETIQKLSNIPSKKKDLFLEERRNWEIYREGCGYY